MKVAKTWQIMVLIFIANSSKKCSAKAMCSTMVRLSEPEALTMLMHGGWPGGERGEAWTLPD